MLQRRWVSLVLLVVCAVGGVALAGNEKAEKAKAQSFTGEYDWRQGGKDSLTANFTPTEGDEWKVAFKFSWNGGNYNWKGTAKGSLADGNSLTGTATNGTRKWTWTASIQDGVMNGEHTELQGDRTLKTGTFSLKR